MPTEGLSALTQQVSLAESGITFVSAADFMAKPLPPPDWIIPDLIAKGMKCDLIGKSKTRKTFMSLQLASCVSTGHDFLGIAIPAPHKVAYINLELMDYFLQERLRGQINGLGLENLGNLVLANIRGKGRQLRDKAKDVASQLKALGCELVIIDPQYKLLTADEDENSGAGMQGILDFRDALAEDFAVLLVAHDTKGEVGHKAITDRGSGTGFLGRDFDFRFVLTPHGDGEPNHVVVSTANRNRPPISDFTAVFDPATRTFTRDETLQPVLATALTSRQVSERNDKIAGNESAQEQFKRDVLSIIKDAGEALIGKASLRTRLDVTQSGALGVNKRNNLLKWMIESKIICEQRELMRKPDGSIVNKQHGNTFVSTKELIAAYRSRFETLGITEE